MSVDGKWIIIIKSPVGPMESELVLTSAGDTFSGTQSGQGQTSEIAGGKIDGNNISWVNQVTSPMKMKLDFSGTIDGDQLTGKVKAGMMGNFTFSGSRQV